MAKKRPGQIEIRQMLRAEFGDTVSRAQLLQFQEKHGFFPYVITRNPNYRVGPALFRVPADDEPISKWSIAPIGGQTNVIPFEQPQPVPTVMAEALPMSAPMPVAPKAPAVHIHTEAEFKAADVEHRIAALRNEASLIVNVPKPTKAWVPYGDYDLVKQIVSSRDFSPVFITGLSGCGKTLSVKQACAESGREYVRCPITTETDEDDLLGGFRLRKGETHFELGLVVQAMVRGSVLLLDEIDKASAKIMCLQPILEGEPITLKKFGITVEPAPGFQVFATANTKGQGDDTGRFITSMLLDEAFLERFYITIEHQYPDVATETEILVRTFTTSGGQLTKTSKAYFGTLARWAENIRKAYAESAADSVIATRRLCHIVRVFKMLGAANKQNQEKALLLCLNRFDNKTKATFLDLYNKHVNDDGTPSNVGSAPNAPTNW